MKKVKKVFERTITLFIVAEDERDADVQLDDAWEHLYECDKGSFHATREGAEEIVQWDE